MSDPDTPPTSVDVSSNSSSSSSRNNNNNNNNNNNDSLDDIFLTSDSLRLYEPSSTSHIARQHTTDGYREGISASKHLHIQSGFDEGYILGAVLGLHVGRLIGCMDGLPKVNEKLKKSARAELALEKVFGKEYFGEDGIWRWDVGGDDDSSQLRQRDDNTTAAAVRKDLTEEELKDKEEETFDHVVQRHPLIVKWTKIVLEEAKRCGLDLESLWPVQHYEQAGEVQRQ